MSFIVLVLIGVAAVLLVGLLAGLALAVVKELRERSAWIDEQHRRDWEVKVPRPGNRPGRGQEPHH